MRKLKSSIFSVAVISLVFFFIIGIIPWHPAKTGELLPYASSYVNIFMSGWGTFWNLILHVLLSLLLGVFTFLGYEAVKRRRSGDHTEA